MKYWLIHSQDRTYNVLKLEHLSEYRDRSLLQYFFVSRLTETHAWLREIDSRSAKLLTSVPSFDQPYKVPKGIIDPRVYNNILPVKSVVLGKAFYRKLTFNAHGIPYVRAKALAGTYFFPHKPWISLSGILELNQHERLSIGVNCDY